MSINTKRHDEVFNHYAFGSRRIDVIGCGATGSRIAMALAKMGVENLHIWDFDKIEEHNIANQDYDINQIGMYKTQALAQRIKDSTDLDVTIHNEAHDGSQMLGGVVFVLTDNMETRRTIYENRLRYKLSTEFMIETRMGADSGRIYAINPCNFGHVQAYEKTLYTDETASSSLCGSPISVGPTADIVAGFAVWQFVRWFNIEHGKSKETELDNEILISTRPPMIFTRTF